MSRPGQILFVSLLGVALCGCQLTPAGHSRVSTALEQRTGLSLGETKPGEFTLPPGISLGDLLTEDQAVGVALWNNAAFLEALADLGLSRADLVQAGLFPNPTVSMLVPLGAKPIEFTARYPLEVLWLRPRRVASAKMDYERTVERLVQTGLDLIRDVKLSVADLALAQDKVHTADQTALLAGAIDKIAQTRLNLGDASELEAAAAHIDVLQAEEQRARARQDERIAAERLRALLGMGLQPFPGRVTAGTPARVAGEVDVLVTNAFAARPDLRAAELSLESTGQRIGLARVEAFTLAAGINSKDVNAKFRSGPALDFAVPIVNQNQGGIALAKAHFEKASRHYYAVRDRIVLEVREAYTRAEQTRESFEQLQQKILPALERTAQQAQKAYEAGDVAQLSVFEAARRLEDARAKAALARADWHRATAELERSVGGRLPFPNKETR